MNHDITHCNGDIKDELGTISCIKKNSCQRYLAHLDLMQHRGEGLQSYTDANACAENEHRLYEQWK